MLKQNQVPKTLNLKLPHLHDLLHIFDDMLGDLPKFRTKRVVVRSICEATAWSSRGSLKGSCNGSIMQVLQQGLESRGFRCGARGDHYAHVKRTEVRRKIRMLDLRYEFLVVPVGSSKLRAHEISGVSRRYGDAFVWFRASRFESLPAIRWACCNLFCGPVRLAVLLLGPGRVPRFLSSPFVIRVPFFLLLGFNKGTLN